MGTLLTLTNGCQLKSKKYFKDIFVDMEGKWNTKSDSFIPNAIVLFCIFHFMMKALEARCCGSDTFHLRFPCEWSQENLVPDHARPKSPGMCVSRIVR